MHEAALRNACRLHGHFRYFIIIDYFFRECLRAFCPFLWLSNNPCDQRMTAVHRARVFLGCATRPRAPRRTAAIPCFDLPPSLA